jgi:hypothetical protein
VGSGRFFEGCSVKIALGRMRLRESASGFVLDLMIRRLRLPHGASMGTIIAPHTAQATCGDAYDVAWRDTVVERTRVKKESSRG